MANRAAISLVTFMLLHSASGCVVVPTSPSEREPYQQDTIGFIDRGVTSKAELVMNLGPPDASFLDGRWFTYRNSRKLAEWFALICGLSGCDGGEFGGNTQQYYLLVHFDRNDTVRHTAVVDESHPCDEDYGVCYEDRLFYLRAEAHLSDLSVNSRCPVALFTSNSVRELWTMRVLLDDRQPAYRFRHADTRALVMLLNPGPHEVSVTYGYDANEVSKKIRLDCDTPEIAYLSATILNDRLEALDLIPVEDGIRQIAERQLVPMADRAIE